MILLGNLVFSLLQSYIFAVKSTLLRDINWVLFYNKTQYSIICPKEMFTQTGGKLSYTRQGRWGETHLCIRRLLSGSLNSRIESFAKLEVVTVWFPVPQVTVETILEVLNSQNSGLHTSQWRVISSIACRGNGGRNYRFAVDHKYMKKLRQIEARFYSTNLNLRFYSSFNILDWVMMARSGD